MLGLWLLLAVLTCGLAIPAAWLALAARKQAHSYDVLLHRLMHVRLYKMLKFLGASPDEYLHTIPAAVINKEIYRCSHCKTQDVCDRSLRDGKLIANMRFCPNHKSLIKHSMAINQTRID